MDHHSYQITKPDETCSPIPCDFANEIPGNFPILWADFGVKRVGYSYAGYLTLRENRYVLGSNLVNEFFRPFFSPQKYQLIYAVLDILSRPNSAKSFRHD